MGSGAIIVVDHPLTTVRLTKIRQALEEGRPHEHMRVAKCAVLDLNVRGFCRSRVAERTLISPEFPSVLGDLFCTCGARAFKFELCAEMCWFDNRTRFAKCFCELL